MLLSAVFVVAGLFMLFIGGEVLIKGAVAIAHRMKMSMLLVSTVVVGFGTSMPELTVSIQAALDNAPDIALGNVVGSNIANVLLILGACAVIAPIISKGHSVVRDVWVMIGSSLLLGLSAYFLKEGGALLGGVYVLLLIAYLAFSYMQDKKGNGVVVAEKANEVAHFEEDVQADPAMKMWKAILFSVGGIAVLIGGAKLLVLGSVDIARTFGVPEAVIGLTLVAVGTSLPELATGVIASFKRHSDVILGNILGSCIFNILAILGITMLFSPIPFTSQIADFDTWLMIAVTLVLLPVVLTGRVISRIEGGIFLTIYIAYTAWLFLGG